MASSTTWRSRGWLSAEAKALQLRKRGVAISTAHGFEQTVAWRGRAKGQEVDRLDANCGVPNGTRRQ